MVEVGEAVRVRVGEGVRVRVGVKEADNLSVEAGVEMVGATRVMIWVLIWFIAVTGSSKHAVSTTNPVNMPARRIPSFGLDEAMNMLILQYPGFPRVFQRVSQ